MAKVEIAQLRKRYGATEVLHGVTIDIEEGEFVALVGPSGCGKSTLLRMIAGLEEISGGTVRVDSQVVNDVQPKDRDIAMVFQNYALYPHMTVAQNLGFSLRLAGTDKAVARERVTAAAQMLGLGELLERYPRQLSGGQRQRVAMGRAIVRNPKVFLFDEPLSNLDAKLRVQMRTEIKGLHQRIRTTTVYVTHDQIEAMTMADRIVVMNAGRIEQAGTPLELYDNPANRFVAEFIGSPAINMFDGEVDSGDGHPVLRVDSGARLPLPDTTPPNLRGRRAVLGVRPEHLLFAGRGDAPPEPDRISADLRLVEPTGAETQLFVEIGGEPATALLRGRENVVPGNVIQLSLDRQAVFLFEHETGRRLL